MSEVAAQRRLDSEGRQEGGFHHGAAHPHGVPLAEVAIRNEAERSHVREGRLVVAKTHVAVGHHEFVLVHAGRDHSDGHQALGLRVRQRAEEDAVHQAEDRGGSADPQGDGERGRRGEDRRAAETAQSILRVLPEALEQGQSAHAPHVLFDQRRVAELAARAAASLPGRHPGGAVQLRAHGEVALHLLVNFPRAMAPAKPIFHTHLNSRPTPLASAVQLSSASPSRFRPAAVRV